jgi:hypothetical protein
MGHVHDPTWLRLMIAWYVLTLDSPLTFFWTIYNPGKRTGQLTRGFSRWHGPDGVLVLTRVSKILHAETSELLRRTSALLFDNRALLCCGLNANVLNRHSLNQSYREGCR